MTIDEINNVFKNLACNNWRSVSRIDHDNKELSSTLYDIYKMSTIDIRDYSIKDIDTWIDTATGFSEFAIDYIAKSDYSHRIEFRSFRDCIYKKINILKKLKRDIKEDKDNISTHKGLAELEMVELVEKNYIKFFLVGVAIVLLFKL